MATSSRSACTGAIRPVRRAGSQAATIVTSTPTTYAATTVRGAKTSGCPDRSSPNRANRERIPIASSTPSARPVVEPSSPSTNASSSTDQVTCRFEAPSARSSASSRLRCATRIENVLTIRKAPTTSAMPAKISRNVVRKLTACSRSEADSSAAVSPVTASVRAGSTRAAWSRSSAWLTPSRAVTHTSVKASLPPRKRSCAVAVSNDASVAPFSDPPCRKPAIPTSRGVSVAWAVAVTSRTSSPTS